MCTNLTFHSMQGTNASHRAQWEFLETLPGVQERSASTILAETGGDMEQFPSPKHLSSWAGVCPGNNRSAGKNVLLLMLWFATRF